MPTGTRIRHIIQVAIRRNPHHGIDDTGLHLRMIRQFTSDMINPFRAAQI